MENLNHILIGLGGTGGKVLKAFRKRIFQDYSTAEERSKLPIGYVYVDSTREMMGLGDQSFRVMGQDASFSESEFVNIKKVDLNAIADSLSSYPGLKGIVPNLSVVRSLGSVGDAAGQKRRAGRILFAASSGMYISTLRAQYSKTKKISGNDSLQIHIFTGLAGGTGSGSIIDVIAQTRKEYPDANIVVYAMIPELDIPSGCEAGRYHQNGYAALKELNALQSLKFTPFDVSCQTDRVEFDNKIYDIKSVANGLMLYSNVNENGQVIDSMKELPVLLSNLVYLKVFLPNDNDATGDFMRAYSFENISDHRVENDEKAKGVDTIAVRTKACGSFGLKRIIYPERRITEHITYTVGQHLLLQFKYNNWVDGLGYQNSSANVDYAQQYMGKKNLQDWRLSDDHLMLNLKVLEDDKFKPINEYWGEVVTGNAEDAKKSNTPLNELEDICNDYFNNRFRKSGVDKFYENKEKVIKEHSQEILFRIEKFLFTSWKEGGLSLHDIISIGNLIQTYLTDKKLEIDGRILQKHEEVRECDEDRTANVSDWSNLRIWERMVGVGAKRYAEHQEILKDWYVLRTETYALEFAAKLLTRLKNDFTKLFAEINAFVDIFNKALKETEEQITDRSKKNKGVNDLTSAIIEISEEDKMISYEKDLIGNRNLQNTFAGEIRHAILPEEANIKEFTPFAELNRSIDSERIMDAFDVVLETQIRANHRAERENDPVLGMNILEQLQKVLTTDDEVKRFADTVVKQSGVYLKLNNTELNREINNNPNPIANPESIHRKTILVTIPSAKKSEMLKKFAKKFEDAIRNTFSTTSGATLVIQNDSAHTDEITIVTLTYCFPMRCIEWLPKLEQRYLAMINNSNIQLANDAKIMLHCEGDGSQYPSMTVAGDLKPEEYIPHIYLAGVLGIIQYGENELEESGWCFANKNKFGRVKMTLISETFVDIATSVNLTNELRDTIVDMVDTVISDPETKKSERDRREEVIIEFYKDHITKECVSNASIERWEQLTEDTIKLSNLKK